jgi:hypothetical protein
MIKPDKLEQDLQTQCQDYLKANHIWYFHKQNSPRQKFRKNTSVTSTGQPDLIILLKNGITLYVELKRPGQKLKPSQEVFKAYCKASNHYFEVCYNIISFIHMIDIYHAYNIDK